MFQSLKASSFGKASLAYLNDVVENGQLRPDTDAYILIISAFSTRAEVCGGACAVLMIILTTGITDGRCHQRGNLHA